MATDLFSPLPPSPGKPKDESLVMFDHIDNNVQIAGKVKELKEISLFMKNIQKLNSQTKVKQQHEIEYHPEFLK